MYVASLTQKRIKTFGYGVIISQQCYISGLILCVEMLKYIGVECQTKWVSVFNDNISVNENDNKNEERKLFTELSRIRPRNYRGKQ